MNLFISYPRSQEKLAIDFYGRLCHYWKLFVDKDSCFWNDSFIPAGEKWHQQIQAAIQKSELGLFLLSREMFSSKYVLNHELPHFIQNREFIKPFIGIGLSPFLLSGELYGVQESQIYFLRSNGKAKFYAELTGENRNKFVLGLIQQIQKQSNHDK